MKRQAETRTSARQYRELLYAASLLLVAFLVYLGIQLRARANALQRRAAFEHVIAMTSMRFINAQPQMIGAEIEQALADMARCIGSDRAYFVLSGPEPRLHVWHSRDSISRPVGREKALEIAVRSRRTSMALFTSACPVACRAENAKASYWRRARWMGMRGECRQGWQRRRPGV